MSPQSAEDKLEEDFNAAIAEIKTSVVERQRAEGTAAKATSDNNVASAIGRCASIWPDPATRGKLLEAQSKYKSADSSGKNEILARLSKALTVKSTIVVAVQALTALSLVGIAGLTSTDLIADQDGNMHEAHTIDHHDGTAQCYVDTNVNGIPDQVQELHQESGEYVADGAAHDPDVSDIWDTILSFFA